MLKDADTGFIDHLRGLLPDRTVRAVEPRYLEEPRGRWPGQAGAVVAPASVDEVSMVLRACNDAGVAVVPYGGGTGLVGGQVAQAGPVPVLLSLERMTKIRAVHPEENVIEVEAGTILQDVHTAAEAVDRLYPLSIASKGSARIGGLLATNAGGVNVLRYGNARDLCLGLEVVLADGRIWNGLSRLRKDNTGYDLRNLMIGSEGTLGVITAASLKLAPRPAGEGTALMVVESPAAALSLLALARDRMGEGISAFELMHRMGLDFLAETLPDIRQPFGAPPEWFVLVDVGLAAGLDPAEALEALFADAFERGLVSDGVIAQSQAQRHEMWELREQIPEANRRVGSISSHDISLPMGRVAEFIEKGGPALGRLGTFRINCFGHLGDGNLHYNVFPPKGRSKNEFQNLRDEIKTCVHDLVNAMGGSVSAEHGIGRLKVDDLERYGDPVKLEIMRGIKAQFDPRGILNPGAVLRAAD
ncbi:FAD-binding oxidoreductase [Lutimaribacter sp. EGI FJ00015]|uniref:FAD-binding oxidoreductase n=1 Tax=Lutimaribacter degradans TaxID=2945989 RepID=A0ACC5ZRB7_9RHOB|nr:FAD-binding oxidoreductase [Lutimaribacter sp. EGI FJ00013]MCM2560637.1 FAD-binding oxidoreductase [Lutimaribacter sp. EGI FJ00013]MCO0612420.1 FAD-binding oxidoreductase [Lutimaribacter sp. EGI FJ00015]MCO0634461.1 FAD-binding oxidoreductase [Lutimaribacter sp. EGI FJ00014]